MNTSVRKAGGSDIAALVELSRRTISASYRSFLGDAPVDAFLDSGAVDRYVAENIERCLVILLDGKVVGYAVSRDNVIDLVMIDQSVHRQGLGTTLLERVETMLFQTYDELVLESFQENDGANTFYCKRGWTEASSYFDAAARTHKTVFRKSGQQRHRGRHEQQIG